MIDVFIAAKTQTILTSHVNDVNDVIGQFPAEVGGKVISSWLYYDQFRIKLFGQFFNFFKVQRKILQKIAIITSFLNKFKQTNERKN